MGDVNHPPPRASPRRGFDRSSPTRLRPPPPPPHDAHTPSPSSSGTTKSTPSACAAAEGDCADYQGIAAGAQAAELVGDACDAAAGVAKIVENVGHLEGQPSPGDRALGRGHRCTAVVSWDAGTVAGKYVQLSGSGSPGAPPIAVQNPLYCAVGLVRPGRGVRRRQQHLRAWAARGGVALVSGLGQGHCAPRRLTVAKSTVRLGSEC